MQIILQEDIEKLGHRGDVVTVKPGYARNFLLPRKLAIEASAGNMKALERIRTSLAKKTATELEAAQKQAGLLNGVSLSFTRKTGENDQMFGSVTRASRSTSARCSSPIPLNPSANFPSPSKSSATLPPRSLSTSPKKNKLPIQNHRRGATCCAPFFSPRCHRRKNRGNKFFTDFRNDAQLCTDSPVDARFSSPHNAPTLRAANANRSSLK
jgi:ribosomal protein L9